MSEQRGFLLILVGMVLIFSGSLWSLPVYTPVRYDLEGYEAGRQGIPVEACPYSPDGRNAYEDWKKGWQKGYLENKSITK